MPDEGDRPQKPPAEERPEYTVYRSRPRLLDRVRNPPLAALRGKLKRGGGDDEPPKPLKMPSERPWWRRALKWVGIAALVWIAISFVAFEVSSFIQKNKLVDSVGKVLNGGPFLLGGQTILVLGTDVRSGAFAGPDEAESEKCLDAINSGKGTDRQCKGNYRSDTIMLVRAGAGTLRKLSIPRDTLANIPGHG